MRGEPCTMRHLDERNERSESHFNGVHEIKHRQQTTLTPFIHLDTMIKLLLQTVSLRKTELVCNYFIICKEMYFATDDQERK